uniref:Uncharacterized protein n=1 Tax=Arundo donax TaxID=35708 RepID=A0A0A9C4F9_ARUDO
MAMSSFFCLNFLDSFLLCAPVYIYSPFHYLLASASRQGL